MIPHIRSSWRGARRPPIRALALAVLAAATAACDASPRAEAATQTETPQVAPPVDAATAAPVEGSGGVIDSVIPIDEALRRFRVDLPATTSLTGGAPSRDALVERFTDAVARRDTAVIRSLALSRAEFAYLYYPTTRYTHKPYELAPALLWFLSQQNGEKGITRMLRRYGGESLAAEGYTCADTPRREGENTLWLDCRIRSPRFTDSTGMRAFGTIIERGGHYKFVSYANDL